MVTLYTLRCILKPSAKTIYWGIRHSPLNILKKNKPVGVRPPHGFHSEEETFSRLRKAQDPGFTDEGIFLKINPTIRSHEESNLSGCDHTSAPLANSD
jgi:hypothetical protein